jgi:hypothetical protein
MPVCLRKCLTMNQNRANKENVVSDLHGANINIPPKPETKNWQAAESEYK